MAVLHYRLHVRSLRKVAAEYNIGKSTLSRWLSRDLGQVVRPKPRPRPTMHDTIATEVSKAINADPFHTANSLVQAVRGSCGALVSRSTIYRTLKRLNTTFKRHSRSRAHEALPSDHPFLGRDSYRGDVIAIDESSFYWNDVPRMGWSLKGTRVPKGRPTVKTRVSLILAVGREGIVHYELRKGGVNGDHFADFVRHLPSNRPLILDNCVVHKTSAVRAVYREKNLEPRFIPPYCPWYNPVEFCFSEIKARFRPLRLRHPSPRFQEDVIACMFGLRHHGAYFEHARTECDKDRRASIQQ